MKARRRLGWGSKVLCLPCALGFAVLCWSSSRAAQTRVCAGDQATLRCLKENFRELYAYDDKRFWNIMYSAEKGALRCDSLPRTKEFLEVIGVIKGDGELSEYFHELIEAKFLKRKPRCFLDVLAMVDAESNRVIVEYYLKRPMYREKEVRATLLRYRNIEKYRAILKHYFEE